MGRSRFQLAATTLLLGSLLAPAAAAQAPSDGDRAVELGRQGLSDFEQGRWRDAYARFAEANALSASPVFELYMARSLRNDGKLLDARARLRAIVATHLTDDVPASWRRAQADARAELSALEPKIPSIVVVTRGGDALDVSLTIDDAPALTGRRIELDPGTHRVRARAGARERVETLDLPEGATSRVVSLDLAPANPPPDRSRRPGPRAPRESRVALELVVGGALTPSFGGPVAADADTIGAGAAATLHAGYTVRSHLSIGVAIGGLILAEGRTDRPYRVTPTGVLPDSGTLDDDLVLRAATAGGTIGLRLGDRVPVSLRLGVGAALGAMTDTRRGTFQSTTTGKAYDSGTLKYTSGASFFHVAPEARVGYRFAEHLEASVGMAVAVLLALEGPTWEDDRTFSAGGAGVASFSTGEALTGGGLVLFTPGVGVRYDF